MRPQLFRCLRCRYVHALYDDERPQVCAVCHGERFVRIIVGYPVELPAQAAVTNLPEATASV